MYSMVWDLRSKRNTFVQNTKELANVYALPVSEGFP
jgi:protein tyrosine phosphatase